jgi:hypothetical protein
MSRNVVEMFAAAYPKGQAPSGGDFDSLASGPRNPRANPAPMGSRVGPPRRASQLRTPLTDVMEYYQEPPEVKTSQSIGAGSTTASKKFLAVLLIVFLGAFLFSSFAYTFSHAFTSKFGLQFFTDDGQPMMPVIVIHSLIFFGLIYLVLNVIRPC